MKIEIKAPTLPESVPDGTIATWHKDVGETVKRDELLVDIETDKVVIEVVAPCNGILEQITRSTGETIVSDELIGSLNDEAASVTEPTEEQVERKPSQMEQVVTHSHSQSHSFKDFTGGYNPHSGFFLSRTILDGDYDTDIKQLEDKMLNLQCDPNYSRHLEDRNTDDIFKIISFKSADGTNETQSAPPEPEIPENFSYTPCLLYTSPSPRDRQKSRMPSSA